MDFNTKKRPSNAIFLYSQPSFFSSFLKSQPKVFHNNYTTRAISPPTVLSDSLRAFWTLTGTKGVQDISGKGQHGTFVQRNSVAYTNFSPGKTAGAQAMYLRSGDWIAVSCVLTNVAPYEGKNL